MLADDFMVKKLKNKELHGLLCNKLIDILPIAKARGF